MTQLVRLNSLVESRTLKPVQDRFLLNRLLRKPVPYVGTEKQNPLETVVLAELRHGDQTPIVLVGPPGSGKTTLMRLVAEMLLREVKNCIPIFLDLAAELEYFGNWIPSPPSLWRRLSRCLFEAIANAISSERVANAARSIAEKSLGLYGMEDAKLENSWIEQRAKDWLASARADNADEVLLRLIQELKDADGTQFVFFLDSIDHLAKDSATWSIQTAIRLLSRHSMVVLSAREQILTAPGPSLLSHLNLHYIHIVPPSLSDFIARISCDDPHDYQVIEHARRILNVRIGSYPLVEMIGAGNLQSGLRALDAILTSPHYNWDSNHSSSWQYQELEVLKTYMLSARTSLTVLCAKTSLTLNGIIAVCNQIPRPGSCRGRALVSVS